MKILKDIKQQSDEWFAERRGRITGKKLKGLQSAKRWDHIYQLVSERLTVEDPDENMATRGNRLEPEAIAFFEEKTGMEVEKVAFTINDKYSFIASSPDGYIKGTHNTEAVEVKCLQGGYHVRALIEKKVRKEHWAQVLQYFAVNPGLKKLHFVFYHDGFIDRLKMVHVVIHASEVKEEVVQAIDLQKKSYKEVEEVLKKLM